jgi:HAD superfamily hydrolase (TIGR01549 family)
VPGDRPYAAVLLDFRGVLVHDPDTAWWIDAAASRVGLDISPSEAEDIGQALERIPDLPGFDEDERKVDTSQEANHEIVVRRLTAVGLSDELAEAFWQLDSEPAAWPVYPDVPATVQAIMERGVKTALVSDFHVDLRPCLRANGMALDAYVISFEHGFQKPDPRMFRTALELLGVVPGEALMVGDRSSHDGGAAAVGIDTLILPPPVDFGPRGLDVLLRLVQPYIWVLR